MPLIEKIRNFASPEVNPRFLRAIKSVVQNSDSELQSTTETYKARPLSDLNQKLPSARISGLQLVPRLTNALPFKGIFVPQFHFPKNNLRSHHFWRDLKITCLREHNRRQELIFQYYWTAKRILSQVSVTSSLLSPSVLCIKRVLYQRQASLSLIFMANNDDSAIQYQEEYVRNSRGMKLMTCRWVCEKEESKALVFLCHGYAMECTVTMNDAGRRLAKAGFEVYGIDYEGHGRSEGLAGFVDNFDNVIEDCSNYFSSICEKEENKKKMRYLVGESMGGALALLLHRKKPHFWDGAILVAPMCKIVDEMKPGPLMIKILTALSKIIPTWKLIPTEDIIEKAFKQPQVREQIRNNPLCYKGRPRLKTGYELFRVSTQLEQTLHEVSLPFLVLHGEDDKVTDKSVSMQLHKVASSKDKTIKLYPGMWHALLIGEPPENLNTVYKDIVDWLEDKCKYGNTRVERELKTQNEDKPKVNA